MARAKKSKDEDEPRSSRVPGSVKAFTFLLVVLAIGGSIGINYLKTTRGAVFLTTDGTRFRRLPFPETIDLVSVAATGDRIATITSADGRSWQTTDQGATWARR